METQPMGGDARTRRSCRLRPSLAEQIRRATWVAESEELSTQRRQLQEDLSLVKDLMAQQQQQQVQSLEDLWQLQVSMERTTLKADAAEQEQQRVAQALRGEMTLCREGQQDLARQLLAKMAELNQKLGANMAQLEDEVTRREHEAEDTRRSHFEALQQECREALQEGRLAGKKAEACEEELAEKTKSVAAEVKRHFSAVVETRAAVTAMRRELQGQQVCSGCKELQNDLKQIGAWSTWLTEILGLPGWPAVREPEPYEAPWTSQLAQQQEELKKHDAELQSQRTLLENLLTQMKEVKTSEQQRQASTEAMEAMAAKQSSSLHSLRQKLAKERKDEAARRASCEEEFSKLRGQIEQDLLDLRKAQAENSVAQAAAVEEKQQALLRHCRAWARDASEVAKDALDERMQQATQTLDDMLKLFTAPERLDKQNSWKCEACSEVVRARKQMMIYQAPNFLVLHLKRFRFMERGKVVKIVPFPPVLNLRPYLCKGAQGEGRPVNYDLRAVIVHVDKAGYSHFGHYIAFVKGATHRKGVFRWFLIDDSIIQEVEEEFVLRQQAYLLFYIRISGGSEATSSEKKRGAKGTEEATLPSRCKGLGGAVCSFFASHDGLCTRCYQEEHGRPPPTSDPAKSQSAGSANGSTPTSNGYAEKAAAKPAAVPAGVPGKAGKSASSAKKKVGPNDPCPCGSGKKYKKCHGGV